MTSFLANNKGNMAQVYGQLKFLSKKEESSDLVAPAQQSLFRAQTASKEGEEPKEVKNTF